MKVKADAMGFWAVALLTAADAKVLEVRRKDVFEFTEKPSVTRQGDRFTITFAVKDFCDATVAIEDLNGGIIRFLASGVLGENAPESFQKNSLRQSIVWDGKDEKGEYVEDKENVVVRVSLGLKPQFERTLYWSPQKKAPGIPFPAVAAAPEGVYVLDGGTEGHQIRLFDHAGTYVRTVHPPPAGRARGVVGLTWRRVPPGDVEAPHRPAVGGFLTTDLDATTGTLPKGLSTTVGARALAIQGQRLFVACQQVNRLATDGTTGGAPLSGPNVFVSVPVPGVHEWTGGTVNVPPRDLAVSADGRWLYLAGYVWSRSWRNGGLCGVGRVPADGEGNLQVFAGTLTPYRWGKADGEFVIATSVDVDPQGRVYVADYGNSRLQVFDAAGKHLKNIPTDWPALVRVNPRNGAIYVFSWMVPSGDIFDRTKDKQVQPTPKMTRFASFEDPRVEAAFPLPEVANWAMDDPAARAAVDFWTDPPIIWLTARPAGYGAPDFSDPRNSLIRLLVEEGRKLVVKRDFSREAVKELARLRPPGHSRWRLHVNPKNGKLYVAEDHFPAAIVVKGSSSLIEIDPATGRQRIVELAFDAEDIAFDLDGQAHLRAFGSVARYDGETWKEVPFDYGENRPVSYQGLRQAEAVSAAPFPDAGNASSQMGGFWVSPRGHVVITSHNPKKWDPKTDVKRVTKIVTGAGGTKETEGLRLMPGRADTCVIRILDKYGRVLYDDAAPGVGYSEGITMDRDDNLYLMAVTPGNLGGRPYPEPYACTLMKFKPQTKVLTPNAPVALANTPERPPDVLQWRDAGNSWVEGLEWAFPGVGMDTQNGLAGSGRCHCVGNSRFALDLFARSFAPELARYDIVVLDANGNVICRIGRYGNVDDGVPLVKEGGPPGPQAIGGDEVALMAPRFVATHTDRRLFIGDRGNERIVSVKLDYYATERIPLRNVSEQKP